MASRTAYSRTQIAKLAKAYRAGASLSTLATKMHRGVSCIRNILVKAGVKMRSRGRVKGTKLPRSKKPTMYAMKVRLHFPVGLGKTKPKRSKKIEMSAPVIKSKKKARG